MTIIHHFHRIVQRMIQGATPLASVFLHFLFPDNFEQSDKMLQVLNGQTGYPKVAILGYLLAAGDGKKKALFVEEVSRLLKRDLSGSSIGQDRIALMGLALGINSLDSKELRVQFKLKVIDQIPDHLLTFGLDEFLLALTHPNEKLAEGTCAEFQFFLEVLRFKQTSIHIQPAAQASLKSYFAKTWKEEFPFYKTDPFRTLLAVYILDHGLVMSVWEPVEVENLKSETLQPVYDRISSMSELKARAITVLIVLLVGGVLSFTSYSFFQALDQNNGFQSIWQDSQNTFFLFGGTIPALLFLVGLVLFLLKKEGYKWDFRHFSNVLANKLKRRMLQRFGLPLA